MDLSVIIGDVSPLSVLAFLIGSILLAALAVIATERFGPYATMVLGTMAVIAAVVDASNDWFDEAVDVHVNNPDLTRFTDWFNHVKLSGASFLIPAAVVLGLAFVFRRMRVPVATRIAVTSVAAMVGIALGMSLRQILFGLTYPDPPT
jgi:hypothetical protein